MPPLPPVHQKMCPYTLPITLVNVDMHATPGRQGPGPGPICWPHHGSPWGPGA